MRPPEQNPADGRPGLTRQAILLVVLLLSAALIWHDLGFREVLGRDENVTIIHVDQPSLAAVLDTIGLRFTGQPGNMQPLYFMLQQLFWPLVQHNAFVLRFLPSMFGILAVALTYKLGAVLLSRQAGLLGALLTALLPLSIRYAQIARPYPLLAAFSLASAYFLVRALDTGRVRLWLGFVLAAALNFYSHYNALFVLAAEGLVAGLAWLADLLAVLLKRQEPRRLAAPLLSVALLAILCLPAVLRLSGLPLAGLNVEGEASGQVTVELTKPFFRGFFFRSGLMSGWLQALVVALAAMGLLSAATRRRWRSALLAGLWIALPFLILAVAPSPRPFEERYVIFVPPMLLLLVGEGVAAAGRWLARLLPGDRQHRRRAARLVALGLAAVLVALLIKPLRVSFAYNRGAGRLEEILAAVEEHAGPGDTVVVSPRFVARPLRPGEARVVYLRRHPSPAEIEALARDSRRLWVLYTSYLPPAELQEPLDRWLLAHPAAFVRVPIKAVNALAFGTLADPGSEENLQARIAVLEDLAGQAVSKYEAWQRGTALADACQSLGDLYQEQGQAGQAAQWWARADAARAAAPPP